MSAPTLHKPTKAIVYPDSDGQPMAENTLQFRWIVTIEGGLEAGLAIAELIPMPTAVVAVNDLTAVGVIKGLLKAGCRVPQDVSVTGFDNTRLAEYSNPSITTVDVHRDMLGKMAADALHELSRSADPQGKEYQIPAELILRDSSGPAPFE